MGTTEIDKLIQELTRAGLAENAARRFAFCALAYNRGWGQRRIGSYLGVSRERARQLIDRLTALADSQEVPRLSHLLETAVRYADSSVEPIPVGFLRQAWEDPEFALGLLNQLAEAA